MEFGLALLETSLFLPPFVLHVQPFRLVSTSCRVLAASRGYYYKHFLNRRLASVGNFDWEGGGA